MIFEINCTKITLASLIFLLWTCSPSPTPPEDSRPDLWDLYSNTLANCKYVDLTHAFHPGIPVWPGFGPASFAPTQAGRPIPGYVEVGEEFSIEKHGFIATAYHLPTDQYGTQLDPPAHWNPRGATISDLPASYTLRPLVVIDIHQQVAENAGYHCQPQDIEAWEAKHGRIPPGSVVMVRSDWHKRWAETDRFNQKPFPGVGLDALKLLHEQRNILFHGHEALDTDTTATLEGEYWLLHHNYCQAEGVANLDQVPESGALIAIGFAKPQGGTGGFARYIAICPPDWEHGVSVQDQSGAPLPEYEVPLQRDEAGVLRPAK